MNYIAFQVRNEVKILILHIKGKTHTLETKCFTAHELQHLIHAVGFSKDEELYISSKSPRWTTRNAAEYYSVAYPPLNCKEYTDMCNKGVLEVPDSGVLFYFTGLTVKKEYM